MDYYCLDVKGRTYGVAYVPEDTPFSPLPRTGRVEDWETMVLMLKEGDYSDYLANDRPFDLCSPKLRDVLDNTKSEYDELQWLRAIVRKESGEEREYYILHLPQGYDVLDKEKTVYLSAVDKLHNNPIKPVISRKLAEKHHVFKFEGASSIRLSVSERVKKAIQDAKCEGIRFEREPVSD